MTSLLELVCSDLGAAFTRMGMPGVTKSEREGETMVNEIEIEDNGLRFLVKKDVARGWLYWGNGRPLSAGLEIVGTIERQPGDVGAIIKSLRGRYYQGNAGVLRSLIDATNV